MKELACCGLGLGLGWPFCGLLRANGLSRGSCGLCLHLHLRSLNVWVCVCVCECVCVGGGGVGRTGRKREGAKGWDTLSLSGVKGSFGTCLAAGQRDYITGDGVSGAEDRCAAGIHYWMYRCLEAGGPMKCRRTSIYTAKLGASTLVLYKLIKRPWKPHVWWVSHLNTLFSPKVQAVLDIFCMISVLFCWFSVSSLMVRNTQAQFDNQDVVRLSAPINGWEKYNSDFW